MKRFFFQRDKFGLELLEKIGILAEWIIKGNPMTANKFDFFRNLLHLVDSCSRSKEVFNTSFQPGYSNKLGMLLKPGCSYTARASPARQHELADLLGQEELECTAAAFQVDCLVQEDRNAQPQWFSKVMKNHKLSVQPFTRFARNNEKTADVMIARIVNEYSAWGFLSKEDQILHSKILEELFSIDPQRLKDRKAESRKFNKVYLTIIDNHVRRVLITSQGNLFDCESGSIYREPRVEVFEADSQLLKTEPRLVFLILDKIAPSPVSSTLVTTCLRKKIFN